MCYQMYYELINICLQWINKIDHLTPMLMSYYCIQQSQPMRICVTISVRRVNVRSVVLPSSEHITRKEITTVLRSCSSIGKVILSIAFCLILQIATLSLSWVCGIFSGLCIWSIASSKACQPGGDFGDYYSGIISLSKATTTHSKIGHP